MDPWKHEALSTPRTTTAWCCFCLTVTQGKWKWWRHLLEYVMGEFHNDLIYFCWLLSSWLRLKGQGSISSRLLFASYFTVKYVEIQTTGTINDTLRIHLFLKKFLYQKWSAVDGEFDGEIVWFRDWICCLYRCAGCSRQTSPVWF